MITVESLAQSITPSKLPPVESWDPPYCGELGLTIKADGSWWYQQTPFTHPRLKLLFSKVIKKEQDDYFLVTPVEKVAIQVEWMPFTLIDFEVTSTSQYTQFCFTDDCDNQVALVSPQQLQMSSFNDQVLPIINIRRNLFASFSRSCYYRLIAMADIVEQGDRSHVQIMSNGLIFSLGNYPTEIER